MAACRKAAGSELSDPAEAFLSEPAIKWSHASPRVGGLRKKETRSAANELLGGHRQERCAVAGLSHLPPLESRLEGAVALLGPRPGRHPLGGSA